MNRNASRLLVALSSAGMALALPIAVATPAQADRCQPEELVLGSGNSPLGDDTGPVCKVMDGTVYPVVYEIFCGGINEDQDPDFCP